MLLHMPFGYGDIGVSGCLSIGSLGMGGSGAGESVVKESVGYRWTMIYSYYTFICTSIRTIKILKVMLSR